MTRVMYDSTAAADIPANADLVAGYLDGLYRWSPADWQRFPHAVHVGIVVNSDNPTGHVLDVENGDATPAGALHWIATRRQLGADPTVYIDRHTWPSLALLCRNARVAVPHCWLATLDGSLPWGPGIVAIQDEGAALTGGHYDRSIVADYWPGVDPSPPHVEGVMHQSQKWNDVRQWYAVYEHRTVEDGTLTANEIDGWARQIADDGGNEDAIQQKFVDGSKLSGNYKLGAVLPAGTRISAIVQ